MPYRRKPQRQNRKRWYLDARIGKNVPILGGTGLRLGTRAVAQKVRRQIMSQEETKKFLINLPSTNLMHNTIYTTQLNGIGQGVTGNNRLGDTVYYCGMKVKLHLAASVPNSYWRLLVIRHRDTFSGVSQTGFGSGIGSSLLFRNNATDPTAIYNTDNVKIVASKVCKVDARFSGENPIRECSLNIPLFKKFKFRTGTQEGEYHNYYLVIQPWSQGTATSGTTVVGNLTGQVEQIYKDA